MRGKRHGKSAQATLSWTSDRSDADYEPCRSTHPVVLNPPNESTGQELIATLIVRTSVECDNATKEVTAIRNSQKLKKYKLDSQLQTAVSTQALHCATNDIAKECAEAMKRQTPVLKQRFLSLVSMIPALYTTMDKCVQLIQASIFMKARAEGFRTIKSVHSIACAVKKTIVNVKGIKGTTDRASVAGKRGMVPRAGWSGPGFVSNRKGRYGRAFASKRKGRYGWGMRGKRKRRYGWGMRGKRMGEDRSNVAIDVNRDQQQGTGLTKVPIQSRVMAAETGHALVEIAAVMVV